MPSPSKQLLSKFFPTEPQRRQLQRKGEGERGQILDSDLVSCSNPAVSHISYLSNLIKDLVLSCKSFKAGCIQSCFEAWSQLTFDSKILQKVRGLKIELNSLDICSSSEKKASLSNEEKTFIDTELLKLVAKRVISKYAFF